MEYRTVGGTGVRVSPLCLGTMSFGAEADEQTSAEMFQQAHELGREFSNPSEPPFRETELQGVRLPFHVAKLRESLPQAGDVGDEDRMVRGHADHPADARNGHLLIRKTRERATAGENAEAGQGQAAPQEVTGGARGHGSPHPARQYRTPLADRV